MLKNLEFEKPKPIFLVDLPLNKGIERIGIGHTISHLMDVWEVNIPWIVGCLHPSIWTSPLYLPGISYLGDFFCSIVGEKFAKIESYIDMSVFYTTPALRSAVSARKIEEFVVPEIVVPATGV